MTHRSVFYALALATSHHTWPSVTVSAAATLTDYFGGNQTDVYLNWIQEFDYPATAFLPSDSDPTSGVALHWRIEDDSLSLAMAVKARGWVGLGLTVNGGMTGADMVLIEAADLTTATDAHVQDERFPQPDDCQDWHLMDARMDDGSGFMLVQLHRKLDTGDNQDLVIRDDSDVSVPASRVIAAWGDDETVSYHGPDNNARGALRWFSKSGSREEDAFQQIMTATQANKFALYRSNYSIPVEVTYYAHFCFNSADLEAMGVNMSEGATVVGFNPIVDNTPFVHHFVLMASFQDIDQDTSVECSSEVMRGETAYVWAPGEPPFSFPDNVGFQLGGESGYKSFLVQIHYDNVNLVESQLDSSGVEVYYTSDPRQYTAGFFMVGDPNVALIGQEIERGLTDYSFDCSGECSSMFPSDTNEPVTVLREYLHMHNSGRSAFVEQSRNGEVVRRGSVEFFDFDQSGNPAVPQRPFQIQPGDSFRIKCYYYNTESGRAFGLGSHEEMCMGFLLYYPRKSLAVGDVQEPWSCGLGYTNMGMPMCDTIVTNRSLTVDEAPERTFGVAADVCDADTGGDDTSSAIALYQSSVTVTLLVLFASIRYL